MYKLQLSNKYFKREDETPVLGLTSTDTYSNNTYFDHICEIILYCIDSLYIYLDCFMSVGIRDLAGLSDFCCCFCFCLYLDRAKNNPSMAFKLPSLASWAVIPSKATPSVSKRSRQLLILPN